MISHSKDGIIKIWSFANSSFPEKSPAETICDHEGKIRCNSCRDGLLGTFDSDGKIAIRALSNPQECLVTHNIENVTKYQQFCICDRNTFVVGNSSAVEFYNMETEFINMVDLEEKICFMDIHGAYLLVGNF